MLLLRLRLLASAEATASKQFQAAQEKFHYHQRE